MILQRLLAATALVPFLAGLAFGQPVDARNPVFNAGAGIVVGAPTGGDLGSGTVNAQDGYFVNGQAIGGALTIPNACVIGGTGTALTGVTLGSNLSCTNGTLSATGGGTPGGTTGQVQFNNAGAFGGLPVGLTGTSTIIQTTSGGLLTPSILPLATTGAFGAVKPDGTTITVNNGVISSIGGAATSVVVGTTTVGNSANGHLLTNNAGVMGDVATSGSGSVALTTSPTFVTPALGTPASGVLTNATGYPASALVGSAFPNAITSAPGLTTVAGGSFGTAAFVATGTSGGTVPLLNGVNTASGAWTFSAGLTGTVTGHSTLDLPLTGGTMTGALHLGSQTIDGSAVAFTGGTISGVPISGSTGAFTTLGATGTTTTAGITDSGGINTTAATGYSIRGTSALSVVGSPGTNTTLIAGFDAGTMVGSTAGAGAFSTFLGDSVGQVYTGAGEVLCAGSLSCSHLTTGIHDVSLGIGAQWWETTGSFDTCTGSDTCRNTIGISSSAAYGQSAMYNYFGSGSVAIGFGALSGNAASLQITGSVSSGETISGILTLTGVTGSPFSWTYTTVSGDSVLATLASHICTAIGIITASPVGSFQCNSTSTTLAGTSVGVVQLTFDGTSLFGNIITLTAATTGSETLTVGGGSGLSVGASGMTMVGYQAGQGQIMTTAVNDTGIGALVLSWLTTGNSNSCGGYEACEFVTSGGSNTAWGFQAGNLMTSAFGNVIVGANAGLVMTTGQNDNLIGLSAGAAITNATGDNFFGRQAGKLVTTGPNDSLFGDLSGSALTGGSNSFFGASSGSSITTGTNNSIFGDLVASTTLTTGSSNLILGTNASCTTPAAGTTAEVILCAGGGPLFTITGGVTPSTSTATFVGGNLLVAAVIDSASTAPTISSGFGSGASVPVGATTKAFEVNVGTGASASSGVILMPAAPHAWACQAVDTTNPATANTIATSTTTTSLTLTNYSRTTGIATAWAASDVLLVGPCVGL